MNEINKLKELIENSDAIMIGAGAGLSTSAGFNYTGERFEKYFFDFINKYHFKDMYSGGFYEYPSKEEFWAYFSRYIYINRYMNPPYPLYDDIYNLIKDKNYFVITTNVDHCFQKAGFDKNRLFYTQGDYGLFQCSVPCHDKTYDNKDTIVKMLLSQGFVFDGDELIVPDNPRMEVDSDLLPVCPICGEPMTMNLRGDDSFVEDEGWKQAANRYTEFLRNNKDSNLLLLELGVGYNTPAIIKYPFWKMCNEWPHTVYVCINQSEAYAPKEIIDKSIIINGDIRQVIAIYNAKFGNSAIF